MIPRRIGGTSPIKHVLVLIKENRTYDQVLGDLGRGNGDPSLAQFGRKVTPNLHAMANRFGTFDNFYNEGTLSADGHNWIVQAEANDYVEKQFGAFYSPPTAGRSPIPAMRGSIGPLRCQAATCRPQTSTADRAAAPDRVLRARRDPRPAPRRRRTR